MCIRDRSGVVYAAADDTATISAYEKTDKKVAELSAATCTVSYTHLVEFFAIFRQAVNGG